MKPSLRPSARVRNRTGWRERLLRLRGTPIQFDLSSYDEALAAINAREDALGASTDADLERRMRELRNAVRGGAAPDTVRSGAFALVREASRRVLGLRPFDVQVVAGLALDAGHIVEMQTGEGKTLTAVMPAALNALTGEGVHILTFNDYLARRDAEWMGPVYRRLGLSVGFVQEGMRPPARRAAYQADVTYVTAKEAGFDRLRDLLATDPGELVHRPFHFGLVDEADSLMIDEARVPLVIAGSTDQPAASASRVGELVKSLSPGTHFDADEYRRNVELTEAGMDYVERTLGCGSLHEERNYALLTELNCALHAQALLRRDVDYIVRNGRVELVDEFTGRVVDDRHWPDGLQAALEAKEGLQRRADGRILGSLTLQRFLRAYRRLCGMTGTAASAASELWQLYGTEVAVIPTHRPMIRIDRPDLVFATRDAKERALVDEVRRLAATGRPILVGTLTVEESERLAGRLTSAGVACDVLNAKNDEAEAKIVARAGAIGAVTISTNMAGRGTDIRLGGEHEQDRDRVVALGGLCVIGTNRHESLRVDLQLRGRAGRQGDPGETRFFVSLEDDLMMRYGLRGLIGSRFVPSSTDEAIDNPIVRAEIARTQRVVEGQNFEIRRTLSKYSSTLEEQHEALMDHRQAILLGLAEPDVWQRSRLRRAALAASAGEEAVQNAERAVTLFHIDRAWREHLSFCADLREGIHLVRLGGQDPLTRFASEAIASFTRLEGTVDEAILSALNEVKITNRSVDLSGIGMRAPSSTWTYLVNDDPFSNQIGMMLSGAGRNSIAMYSAAVLMPLLVLWAIVDRLFGKRPVRRSDL